MAETAGAELATVRAAPPDTYRSAGTVEELVARRELVKQVIKEAMVQDVHYGVVPGTDKPALLKPGAEYLDNLFRFRPEFRHELERDGDHLTVTVYCTIVHIPSGDVLVRDAIGMCSTRESKYAWRKADRVCPECGVDAILKSKQDEGWFCWAKRGGCGSKFDTNDVRITKQETGRKLNPDLPDQWNTVSKMSEKRSHVGCTLMATGASDLFTQDIDETMTVGEDGAPAVRPNGSQRGPKVAEKIASEKQIEFIRNLAAKHHVSETAVAEHYGAPAVDRMSMTQAKKAIDELVADKGKVAWAVAAAEPIEGASADEDWKPAPQASTPTPAAAPGKVQQAQREVLVQLVQTIAKMTGNPPLTEAQGLVQIGNAIGVDNLTGWDFDHWSEQQAKDATVALTRDMNVLLESQRQAKEAK